MLIINASKLTDFTSSNVPSCWFPNAQLYKFIFYFKNNIIMI